MPLVEASGIQVNFPFDPYPCQVTYMEKLISCLRSGQNGILESPTGTGKTLCLLCSSLAWLENKKAQVSNQRWRVASSEVAPGEALNEFKELLTGQLDAAAGTWEGELAPPKIIFASRTHSQLTQAVQELKRTAYRHFKVCVLGSREQLCIHPQVMKEESNTAKVHLCRAKVQNRSCHFYNQLETAKGNFSNQVLDIEDMVSLGQKHNCCPYYAARELKPEADIIFMPYNYLLDVKSRRAHGVELQGNIVIFDEAHNLEKICEDSASFDLRSSDIAAAMRELSELSDKVLEWVKEEEMGAGMLSDSQMAISQDFTLKELLQLKAMLSELEEQIDAIPLPRPTEGVTKPGCFIFEVLKAVNLTFETKTPILELVEKIITHLTNETTSGIFHSRGAGLSKFADVLKLVFSRELEDFGAVSFHQRAVSKHYKVHIRQEEAKKSKKGEGWGSVASTKPGRVLSYWCFSPGHAMEELKAHGVKSIVLTSGTMSPLSSFKTEMGLEFGVELENPHVIEKHQVWIGTVGKGPDGSLLNSSYEHRFKESYQSSLGNAIVNFARVVPNGLLLFFPSYTVMDKCLEHWQSTGIWSRIEQYKPVFVEPRHKAEFHTAMLNFYEKINDPTLNGAIFAAVCRGKVSEGLDFSDNNGRAVVITGLPFPPRMDPKVMLKMQFLDEMRQQNPKGLSGQEWYRQQATRAVNQAIGRVIRHKQDFGAIILCDNRFSSSQSREQLPVWVRPSVTNYSAFGLALKDIMGFFKTAEKLLPPPGAPKSRGALPAARGSSGAYFMPTVTRTSSAGGAQVGKASAVIHHAPSLRRKPYAAPDEMSLAKLKVQYEPNEPVASCSSASSTKKSSSKSLLDALSTSESRHISKDDDLEHSQIPSYQQQLRAATQAQTQGRKKILVKKTGSASDVRKDTLQSAEAYIAEVKQTLSAESYVYFSQTLANYRNSEDFSIMANALAEIFTQNKQSHHLFRRFYRFVRPHHKEQYDKICREIIGQGCGFKPQDAVPKKRAASTGPTGDSKKAKMETSKESKTTTMDTKSTAKSNAVSAAHSLDTASHLGQQGLSSSASSCTTSLSSQSSNTYTLSGSLASARSGRALSDFTPSGKTSAETAGCESQVSSSGTCSSDTKDQSSAGLSTGPASTSCTTSSSISGAPGLPTSSEGSSVTPRGLIATASLRPASLAPHVESTAHLTGTTRENFPGASAHPSSAAANAKENEPSVIGTQSGAKHTAPRMHLGYDCCHCHQASHIPLQAPCGHVCCAECWKIAIKEKKACPKCGVKVKKKYLSQICFERPVGLKSKSIHPE